MFRKLLLPALAAVVLAGCVTDYTYRGHGGSGDYYYGRPSVEYRYYGGYGGYGGGYGGYYGYPYGYGGYWGNPYPYRYGYYPSYGYPRYPYYRYPYRYDRHPGHHPGQHPGKPRYNNGGGGNGPWTGAEDLRRRIEQSQRPPQPNAMPRSGPGPTRANPPRAMGEPRPTTRPTTAPRPRPTNSDRGQEHER